MSALIAARRSRPTPFPYVLARREWSCLAAMALSGEPALQLPAIQARRIVTVQENRKIKISFAQRVDVRLFTFHVFVSRSSPRFGPQQINDLLISSLGECFIITTDRIKFRIWPQDADLIGNFFQTFDRTG